MKSKIKINIVLIVEGKMTKKSKQGKKTRISETYLLHSQR